MKLVGRFLHVWTRGPEDGDRIKALLKGWYCEQTERVFGHRLQLCLEHCPSLRLAREPRVTILRMPKRWGSCAKAGNILLNLELIKVLVHCIDYVIVHELRHLQINNHSAAFYRLLGRCMPNWERRKRRLDGLAV